MNQASDDQEHSPEKRLEEANRLLGRVSQALDTITKRPGRGSALVDDYIRLSADYPRIKDLLSKAENYIREIADEIAPRKSTTDKKPPQQDAHITAREIADHLREEALKVETDRRTLNEELKQARQLLDNISADFSDSAQSMIAGVDELTARVDDTLLSVIAYTEQYCALLLAYFHSKFLLYWKSYNARLTKLRSLLREPSQNIDGACETESKHLEAALITLEHAFTEINRLAFHLAADNSPNKDVLAKIEKSLRARIERAGGDAIRAVRAFKHLHQKAFAERRFLTPLATFRERFLDNPLKAGGVSYTALTLLGLLYILTLSISNDLGLQLVSAVANIEAFLVIGFAYTLPSVIVLIVVAVVYFSLWKGLVNRLEAPPAEEPKKADLPAVHKARDLLNQDLEIPFSLRPGIQPAFLFIWIATVVVLPIAVAAFQPFPGEKLNVHLENGAVLKDRWHLFRSTDYEWYSGGTEGVVQVRKALIRCTAPATKSDDVCATSTPSSVSDRLDHLQSSMVVHHVAMASSLSSLHDEVSRIRGGAYTAPTFARDFLECTAQAGGLPAMTVLFNTGEATPKQFQVSGGARRDFSASDFSTEMKKLTRATNELYLAGFADNVGPTITNLGLAERRVEAVAGHLEGDGYLVRKIHFGEQWATSAAFTLEGKPMSDNAAARVVQIFVCSLASQSLASR